MDLDIDIDIVNEEGKSEEENLKKQNEKQNYKENEKILIKINCLVSYHSHNKSVTSISWSKNEKFLLTSSISKEIFLWNPFEPRLLKKFNTYTDIVSSVKWINEELFVAGGIDKKMKIESIERGQICSESFSRIRSILISQGYHYIILIPASINDIVFYDYKNFKEVNRLTELDPIISANISQKDEGSQLIVNLSKVNASINLYEISNLKLKNKFYGHTQEQYSIECSFAGEYDEYIICGSEDACIYIWHISDSIPIRKIKGHTGSVNSCYLINLFNNDLIFSVSDDHTLRLWGNKGILIEYEDSTNLKKKNQKEIMEINGNNKIENKMRVFDVINPDNNNNIDISLGDDDGSEDESSHYYTEEDC
jgi:WD40 repeat protein